MKISAQQYAQTLLTITDGKMGSALTSVVKDFVAVLHERHELSRWREIVRAFDNAWRRKFGVSEVSLITAVAPTKKLVEELQKAFPQASLRQSIDAMLIGGAVIQVDDCRFDGSVAGALSKLHDQLLA